MDIELDWNRYYPFNSHFTHIAILTGLDIEEIEKVSPKKDCWGGQSFVNVFRELGFNCNNRWVKFDPNTDLPCLIRFKSNVIKEPYWYLHVYYKNIVYMGNSRLPFDQWIENNSNYRITSMLQVWI